MKGSLVAAYTTGKVVWLCFRSPTGDSSDSHLFQMTCHNEEQAQTIAQHHRDVWDIPNYAVDSEVTDHEERRLRAIVDRGLGYTL